MRLQKFFDRFDSKDTLFIAAAILLFAVRIWVGREMGVFMIAASPHDDMLMMRYAHLYDHFIRQTAPYNFLLIKDMSFPLFLNFVRFSWLPYTDWLAILWLIAAALMAWLFALITGVKNRFICLLVYAYVLFMPIAFAYTGRRIYRQALLSPLYFITLEMITLMFVFYWNKIKMQLKPLIFFSGALGVFFTLTYYVKEDGVWLLLCLIAALLPCLIRVIFGGAAHFKNQAYHVAIILLPLIIFSAGTVAYKAVNYAAFGVWLINDRTEGELGRFVKLVYKVKSDERTGKIWAPTDAIERVFEVSETLRRNERLKDAVMHTGWRSGDIVKNPIQGDFLGWVMLSALKDSETCRNAVEQEDFLRKVNDELDAAFAAGILEKDDKLQLISSMGGRSPAEILDLGKPVAAVYLHHVALYNYDYGLDFDTIIYPTNEEGVTTEDIKDKYHDRLAAASKVLNIDLFAAERDIAQRALIAGVIFKIYAVLNSVLFLIAIVALFKTARMPENKWQLLIFIGYFLLAPVYALAISWFSEFTSDTLGFYSNGVIPMLTIFELLGAYRFCVYIRSRRNNFE